MLSELKFLLVIFCLTICIDIVYGNNINELRDLVYENISLEDKANYLDSIKKTYSFSAPDISILIQVFEASRAYVFFPDEQEEKEAKEEMEREGEWWKNAGGEEVKDYTDEINNMNRIRTSILEILLRDDVNGSILTEVQLTILAHYLYEEVVSVSFDDYRIRRGLALKALIKINTLRPNTDDKFAKELRNQMVNIYKKAIEDDPEAIAKLFRALGEENASEYDIQGLIDILQNSKSIYDEGNLWLERTRVEDCIFDPMLQTLSESLEWYHYKEQDKRLLLEYEQYLLKHLKSFPITPHLQELVKRAFVETNSRQFKLDYIVAMSDLDMGQYLIKILLDNSLSLIFRKQALETSIKHLDHIGALNFRRFSISLLQSLEKISSDTKEPKTLRQLTREKIKLVESKISGRDEFKDLNTVIFNSDISTEEKIRYLNETLESGFYFSKERLSFIISVINNKDLDIRVKARASSIVIFRSNTQDILNTLVEDDINTLKFLWWVVDLGGDKIKYKCFRDDIGLLKWFRNNSSFTKYEDEVFIELSARFDVWNKLINYINGNEKNTSDAIRKLAIRTCLDLLPKTKNYEEFSKAFLTSLEKVASDKSASTELRGIADFILLQVRSGKCSLKDGNCILKFSLPW